MKKKIACLIYSNHLHYLDHLAPLCYFFKIPFITNVEKIANLAKKNYPNITIQFIDNLNIHFYIVKNFETIISCITKKFFDVYFKFHQDLLNKNINIIWCPHGNSDKGKTCLFFENLKNEKFIFVYGQKMIDILKEKKVLSSIQSFYEIGNYRLVYYKKFKKFFDHIVEKKIKKTLPNNKINILYAPTWKDKEKSSSFDDYLEKLLLSLPKKYNLIVKLHPNLIEKFFDKIQILKIKYNKKNILFLDNFPVIYSLLNFIDIYLGDFSSIGYDFLYFQKPMFFLPSKNKKLNSDLYKCGYLIKSENIYKEIEKNYKSKQFNNKKKTLYKYTFQQKSEIQIIKKQLLL